MYTIVRDVAFQIQEHKKLCDMYPKKINMSIFNNDRY